MLEQMRKHMNWIMWTILVVIIVTFLFFGIYPSGGSRGIAATVNGDTISTAELNRVYRSLYETYRQIFKDQFSDALAKNLRSQALRELVSNRLLVQEASRMGLRVSDEELRDTIMHIPSFSPGGRFDQATYERYLDYINVKPSAFEESQRESLVRQKLERIIEEGVDVTDAEAREAYAKRNPKAKEGEYEKNRDAFRKSLLTEKRRNAVEAFVRGLEKKSKITTTEEATAS
jgi:peptidyl-prolyl cis-trans isomerase D